MVWEKTSNFWASFPSPINTYRFSLVSSEKAHWHAEGLLRGLNLSRYVSICGTRAFLYLLTDRFIALQGVLHKSTCLQSLFFILERPLLGSDLVMAPQFCAVGRPGSSTTKGALRAGLYGQPWSEWGLEAATSDLLCHQNVYCLYCLTATEPTLWNTPLSVLGEELWYSFEETSQKRNTRMWQKRWCW